MACVGGMTPLAVVAVGSSVDHGAIGEVER